LFRTGLDANVFEPEVLGISNCPNADLEAVVFILCFPLSEVVGSSVSKVLSEASSSEFL